MSKEPVEMLTLTDIAGGAAIEAVDTEIRRVLENILDPNCDPAKKRKVQLDLIFMPNKDNANLFGISIQAKSVLVAANPVITTAYADTDANGKVCASELRPGLGHDQGDMLDYAKEPIDVTPADDGYDKETGEVIDFRKRAAGGK